MTPKPATNLREQLGEIVAVLINPISSQAFLNVDYRKLKDEAINTLEVLCQEIAREVYKKGYVAGGVDEILRHEDARKTVLAELTHKPEEEKV